MISFLLTPFILTSLGLELFGVWAFIGAGLSFVLLLSLGLGRSATRFIAVVSESGDIESVRRIVSYSVLSHACVGLVLVAVAYGTARALLPHTTVPEHQQSLAQTIFVLMACVSAFGFMLRPFASLIIGLERMWITAVISQVGQVAYAATVIALLSLGAGLYGLVGASLVLATVQGGSSYFVARRLMGESSGTLWRSTGLWPVRC